MMSQINEQNIASVPHVTILPQTAAGKSLSNGEVIVPRGLPVESLGSPKSSIILQPPTDIAQGQSFILGKVRWFFI